MQQACVLHWGMNIAECDDHSATVKLARRVFIRVNHAKRLGVKVGLGTDVAGGYSPSMLNALRSAVVTSKALRMQHLAPTEHGTEPSPANSHLLDYKVCP